MIECWRLAWKIWFSRAWQQLGATPIEYGSIVKKLSQVKILLILSIVNSSDKLHSAVSAPWFSRRRQIERRGRRKFPIARRFVGRRYCREQMELEGTCRAKIVTCPNDDWISQSYRCHVPSNLASVKQLTFTVQLAFVTVTSTETCKLRPSGLVRHWAGRSVLSPTLMNRSNRW